MAVKNLVTGEVHTRPLSLLQRIDGRRYSKYEEKLASEMCYYMVRELWDDILSKTKLIVLEKSMIAYKPKHFHVSVTEQERALVYVESSLKGVLLTHMHLLNGPLVLVASPIFWKKAVGVQVGGHSKALTQAQQHLINKGRSEELFRKLYEEGDEEVRTLVQRQGIMKTDEKEAFFLLRALEANLEKKMKEASKISHHNKKLSKIASQEEEEAKPKKKKSKFFKDE